VRKPYADSRPAAHDGPAIARPAPQHPAKRRGGAPAAPRHACRCPTLAPESRRARRAAQARRCSSRTMTRRTCRALCATRAWTMRRTTSRAPRATRRPAAARRTSTMQTTASPSTLAQGSAGSAARSRCAPAPHRRVRAAAPRPPSAAACRAHSMARRSVNARGRRSNAVARARRAGRRGGVRRHRRVRPVRALPAGHVAGQQPALPPLRVPEDRAQPGKPQARASGRGALPGRPARSPPALQQRTLWLGGARGSAGVYGEAGMREGGHVRWCRGMSGRTAGARKPWAQGRGQPRAATPLRRPRSAAAATCAPASGVVRCWEQGSPTAAFCLAGTLTGSARPRSTVPNDIVDLTSLPYNSFNPLAVAYFKCACLGSGCPTPPRSGSMVAGTRRL